MTTLLTVPAAARQVGVSRRVLYRAIASGQLPAFALDTPRRPRVRLADVVSWIEATRVPRTVVPPTPGFDAKRVAASLREGTR